MDAHSERVLRYLSSDDLDSVRPDPVTAVGLAERALVLRAQGDVQVPPKPAVFFGDNGFANAMPVAAPQHELLGCKWISLQPENPDRGLPTATGLMIVCDANTGAPVCLMSAAALTSVRTAAVTGACLRSFVAPDEPVCFVGTGVQARSHLRVLGALGYEDLRVVGRRPEALAALADEASSLGVDKVLTLTESIADGLSQASAIITGLPIGLQGTQIRPDLVRPDAVLLPLDYASSVGADLAATATVVSDDVEQFAAVAPVKLGADYPLAAEWTGNALSRPRPAHPKSRKRLQRHRFRSADCRGSGRCRGGATAPLVIRM